MSKIPKTRASGTMTEAQFIAFIKSALRSKSRFWKPLSDTLKSAHVSRGHYLCNMCKQVVTKSTHVDGKRVNNVYVDHISPVVSVETGFTSWQDFINNLFCETDNLQVLCLACHTLKTKEERLLAKANKDKNIERTPV